MICYHFDDLNDNNYLTETQDIITLMQILTKRYGYKLAHNVVISSNKLFLRNKRRGKTV